MAHPEIEQAEQCWKQADLALREARATYMASATDANTEAVAQAELTVEKCEADWEAMLMEHGIPEDGVPFDVATQFLFQKRDQF